MKKNSLKLISVILVLVISLLSVNAYATEEKLYEKYGFQAKFKYEDETVAHALKSTVVFVMLEYYVDIEYRPLVLIGEDVESFVEDNSDASQEEIAEYIVHNYDEFFEYGPAEKVRTSIAAQGSGVVISEDGYVATNSHVASGLTKENKEQCVDESAELNDAIWDNLYDIEDEVVNYGISFTDDQLVELGNVSYGTRKVEYEEEQLYVCFPSESGETDIKKERAYEAEIVEEGTAVTNSSVDGLTQDVAILKIDEDNLIALKLSDSYPEAGSKITSAGFPAAADAVFSIDAGSNKSALSVSIDNGSISRRVPIDNSDYDAMQITTTISNGSSGGPSVDENLNVEGLNTYVNNEDYRFAYMVPAEYVVELAKDVDNEQKDVTKTFLTGLQMLQQGYGGAALECFKEVEKMRESTPYIKNLIELSKKTSDTFPEGNENKQEKANKLDIGIIIAVALVVCVILLVVITLVLANKKKKKSVKAKVREVETIFSDVKRVHQLPESGSVDTFNSHHGVYEQKVAQDLKAHVEIEKSASVEVDMSEKTIVFDRNKTKTIIGENLPERKESVVNFVEEKVTETKNNVMDVVAEKKEPENAKSLISNISVKETGEKVKPASNDKSFFMPGDMDMDSEPVTDNEKVETEEKKSDTPLQNDTKKCIKCGNEISVKAMFCGKCGTKQEI